MPTEVDKLKRDVEELQSQLAFQEDAVKSLDGALARQQQEILTLRRQVELLHQRLREQLAAQEGGQNLPPVEEKPPHY